MKSDGSSSECDSHCEERIEAPLATKVTDFFSLRKRVGGPYKVSLSKPYKPVFIVFVDLWFFLVVSMATLVFNYLDLEANSRTSWETISEFLPLSQVIVLGAYLLKLILDYVLLTCIMADAKNKDGEVAPMNSSATTPKLFFSRILFDVVYLGFLQIYFAHYIEGDIRIDTSWMSGLSLEQRKHIMDEIWMHRLGKLLLSFLPTSILETILYQVSVRPARERQIW